MEGMVRHGDLWCTAWDGSELIGVARSLTDWTYVCYLSDLAIDQNYQHQGIGLELLRLTQQALHPQARIVLLAAPLAEAYYPKIGMDRHNSAWTTLALPLLSKRGDRQ